MIDPERSLTLRQTAQARDDFAQVMGKLDFVKAQLARLPTRIEILKLSSGCLLAVLVALLLIRRRRSHSALSRREYFAFTLTPRHPSCPKQSKAAMLYWVACGQCIPHSWIHRRAKPGEGLRRRTYLQCLPSSVPADFNSRLPPQILSHNQDREPVCCCIVKKSLKRRW
jgi:hypothetical protein